MGRQPPSVNLLHSVYCTTSRDHATAEAELHTARRALQRGVAGLSGEDLMTLPMASSYEQVSRSPVLRVARDPQDHKSQVTDALMKMVITVR